MKILLISLCLVPLAFGQFVEPTKGERLTDAQRRQYVRNFDSLVGDVSDPNEIDKITGQFNEEFVAKFGEDPKLRKQIKESRDFWVKEAGYNPRTTLDNINLLPIDIKTATPKQIEEWEQKTIEANTKGNTDSSAKTMSPVK